MSTVFEKARLFMYRNARPVDIARWQYHFEKGGKEAVLTALSAYQNDDGGFGHALEADSWNPHSSPIQTWAATEILKEIDFADREHPILCGILRYLGSGTDFIGDKWTNTVPTNNDYPGAPWWNYNEETNRTDYNPNACLVGFALAYAEADSTLYETAVRLARKAAAVYLDGGLLNDMHRALCYVRLMEYCEKAKVVDVIDIAALKTRLLEQVRASITQNTAEWETGYICKPSQFFNSRESIFYADNKRLAEYECEYIEKTQLADGSWNIPWNWNKYPEEWAISKNWWKGYCAILNMLYLRGISYA
jgi:hypothetical protein